MLLTRWMFDLFMSPTSSAVLSRLQPSEATRKTPIAPRRYRVCMSILLGIWGRKREDRPALGRRRAGRRWEANTSVERGEDQPIGSTGHAIEHAAVIAPAGVTAVADIETDAAHRSIAHDGIEDAGVGRAKP